MIPILYENTETKFESNGLGRLPDAIQCEVTEERNGAYELEMVYPITGLNYSKLTYGRFIFAIPSYGADPQPFEIYGITKPLNGQVTVYAQHISYRLSLVPVMPFTASSCTEAFAGMVSNAAEACPFTFHTDKSVNANFKVEVPSSLRSLLGGQEGSILDVFGTGEYKWDRYKVSFLLHRGETKSTVIRYGKNLTDISQEESIERTITGIVPYWKGTVSDDSGNSKDVLVMLDEKVVQSEYADKFPYHRTVPVDFTSRWTDQPTQEQLRIAAKAYVKESGIGVPKVSLTVSFLNLANTVEYAGLADEDIRLCDTVTVLYEKLGISATAKVVTTVWDVLKGQYSSIELGDSKSSLSSTLASHEQQTAADITETRNMIGLQRTALESEIESAKESATQQITDLKNLTGYAFIHYNSAGNPYEFIVADNEDLTKAVKVWRWNKSGLGFSSTGYNGDYGTMALTADGMINASRILTGVLTANLIRAGNIQDLQGKNSWNLETGEFVSVGTISSFANSEYYGQYIYTKSGDGKFSVGTCSDLKGTNAREYGAFTYGRFANVRGSTFTGCGIRSSYPVFISSGGKIGFMPYATPGENWNSYGVETSGYTYVDKNGLHGSLHDEDGYTGNIWFGKGYLSFINGIMKMNGSSVNSNILNFQGYSGTFYAGNYSITVNNGLITDVQTVIS